MITFLSSWVKNIGLAIVIVSILEMLLPNNKTKKYIRMVMGIYILFNIISPIIKNKELFDINEINLETYTTSTEAVNQISMDNRIEELYIEELEKDITKKMTDKGYKISNCKVKVKIGSTEEETKIDKIEFKVINKIEEKEEINLENTIVSGIQKIKKVDTVIKEKEETSISNVDKQNIKKFLIEEYGVNEECLQIN